MTDTVGVVGAQEFLDGGKSLMPADAVEDIKWRVKSGNMSSSVLEKLMTFIKVFEVDVRPVPIEDADLFQRR